MAKKCLYEGSNCTNGVVGSRGRWGMRSAERRKVNVLEMKYLRSFLGVSRMDRVRNEEVSRRALIENGQTGVDSRSKWMAGTRETQVRLDGWCEGGLGQQRNVGGGCATMFERSERVESPGTYVTE